MKDPDRPRAPRPKTFSALRRWLGRADFALSVVLALYSLVVANILAFRHPAIFGRSLRLDLTSQKIHTLSRATLDRLRFVREEIRVLIPTYLRSDDPEHQAYREVLGRARLLLNQYVAAQPLIRIAAEVDAFARPEEWLKLRERYGLTAGQLNRFIFVAGPSGEYRQAVGPADMASFGESRDPTLVLPEIRSFRAEKAMTDAISRLIERKKRVVGFTQDKEELSIQEPRGRGPAVLGLTALVRELETHGIEARPLSGLAQGIPPECDVVAILGPMVDRPPGEIDALRAYLRRGGRLFVALGRGRTTLEDLLDEFGVAVLPGEVRALTLLARQQTAKDEVAARWFDPYHPITKAFRDVRRFEVLMDAPRALQCGGFGKGLQVVPILEARSEKDNAERFYRLRRGETFAGRKPGDHVLAAAVAQHVPERPPPGFQRLPVRIVVAGGSTFLADERFLQGSHRDFALNAFAWLLGEEEKATAGGEDWARVVLPATPSVVRFLFLGPVVLLPAFFLALGAVVYAVRRS
ncbi:MAG: Gldg family protein [Planctomycetota bacterium]